MITLNLILAVLCAALYLQVGHQHWIMMLLTDPQSKDCPLAADLANFDQLPPAARMSLRMIRALYVVGWPIFFLIADCRELTRSESK